MDIAMHGRSPSLLLSASGALIALGLAATPGIAGTPSSSDLRNGPVLQVAETDSVPDGDVEDPNKLYPVTPKEVAECMKAWDPQTQMSKAEFEASCKSSLKYFPEDP
jgi:hypothetical protein